MSRPPAAGRLPPLAVIADDLTGSCDTAAQFSRFGMRVAVTGASRPRPAPRPRSAGGQHGLARAARRAGSRSGGPLGQSTAGFRQPTGLQEDRLDAQGPLVPGTGRGHGRGPGPISPWWLRAFPAWRRTTRGGTLLLDGRPLPPRSARGPGTTEIGSGDLLGRLRAEFGSQVELVRRHLLRQAPATVEKRIQTARRKGHRVLLFDIESDSDLERLALTGRRLDESVLWVGSAGLARFLPLSWGGLSNPRRPGRPGCQGTGAPDLRQPQPGQHAPTGTARPAGPGHGHHPSGRGHRFPAPHGKQAEAGPGDTGAAAIGGLEPAPGTSAFAPGATCSNCSRPCNRPPGGCSTPGRRGQSSWWEGIRP